MSPVEYKDSDVKRFGYIISAVMLIISNVALINEWETIPIVFLITMYFLTASLWAPSWIRPFYKIIQRYFFKKTDRPDDKTDLFSKN